MTVLTDILKGVAKFAGENAIIGLAALLLLDKYSTLQKDVEFSKTGVSAAVVEMAKVQTKLEGVTGELKEIKEIIFFQKHAMKGE